MRKIANTTLAAVAGLFVSASLQAAALPGFQMVAQTTHFTFFGRPGTKVEAGKSEAFVAKMEHDLGHQVEGKATYYRHESAQDVAAATGSYAGGITFPGERQIHSTEAFHAHEIVHLVAGQLGDPGVFFQEGLAVALGNEGVWRGRSAHDIARGRRLAQPLSALIAGFSSLDAETAYPLAGSFVQHLIEREGLPKVASFFRACGPKSADAEGAFLATFGQTFDEAGQEWSRWLAARG